MGQKVNPIGFRLAVNKDWRSKWYATGQDYATKLHEDLVMRKYIKEQLMSAAVSSIVIERAWNSVRITVHTARPGLVIGRKGEELRQQGGVSAGGGGFFRGAVPGGTVRQDGSRFLREHGGKHARCA